MLPNLAVTALLAVCGCADVSKNTTSIDLHAGRELKTPSSARVALVWVVSSDDCSSCNSPGYFWRALLASTSIPVSFRVLVVGSDTASARALMQAERIAASVEPVLLAPPTKAERLPAMALVLRDTIRFVWPARGDGPFYSSLLSGAGVRSAVRVVDSLVKVAKPK